MINRFLFFVFLVSAPIYGKDKLSLDMLNKALTKNYSFVERSLNQSAIQIEESSGEIFFENLGLTVNINTPFKERYRVLEDLIEIYDIDLEQTRTVRLDDINNVFISALIYGVQEQSTNYQINYHDGQTLELLPIDSSPGIKFFFNSEKLKLIRYTDSVGVEHGIELTQL